MAKIIVLRLIPRTPVSDADFAAFLDDRGDTLHNVGDL